MALARTNRGTKSLSLAVQATNTLVSDSFTPAAGALLVVLFNEYTTDATPSLDMSSTFSGQGAWTTYSHTPTNDGFGNYFVNRIAVSRCGASPGSGTVTCTRRPTTTSMSMFAEFIEATGDGGVAQSKTNLGTGSSLALNFDTAPAASSYVFSTIIDGGGGSITVPSGFTELGSFALDGTWRCEHAEDLGSAAQNNSWTSLGSFNNGAVAIEVTELSGFPITKRWGGTTGKGRW